MMTATVEKSADATISDASSQLPALLKSSDLARLFRVQIQTISLWARNGVLPTPVRLGQKYYWRREVIERLIAQAGAEGSPADSPDTATVAAGA